MKTQTMPRSPAAELPPLHSGDRLKQPEFHRRYEAYPEHFKIELVGGQVYVASSVWGQHLTLHAQLGMAATLYGLHTPGTESGIDATVILSDESEPQPDVMLRLLTEFGGQSAYNPKQYLVGGPEFLGEIAHSTVAIDMHRKKTDYFRAGVQEYLVVCVAEQELNWFHFPSRRKLKPTRNGIWKSKVFPGLWIDGAALLRGDGNQLHAVLQQGLASPEHAEFVKQLARRRRG